MTRTQTGSQPCLYSPKYVCQKCRTRILTDDLEAVFVEELKGMIFSPDSIAGQLASVDTEIIERTALP